MIQCEPDLPRSGAASPLDRFNSGKMKNFDIHTGKNFAEPET